MIITVTSLRLNHWWNYFGLSLRGLKIMLQAKQQKGFISMKNTGFGYLHFTLSVWESDSDLRDFARSGAHREAMKRSQTLADEIGIYTFRSERVPNWKEAKKLLFEYGKFISFDKNTKSGGK